MNQDEIKPLLDLREKIEKAIQGYLDKAAALRKRYEAVNTAINLLRSEDDELLTNAPKPVRTNGHAPKEKVNRRDLKDSVYILLSEAQRRLSKAEIAKKLDSENIPYSIHSLGKVLRSEEFVRYGEREQSVYQLKTPDAGLKS